MALSEEVWKDLSESISRRVEDLLGRLTVEELCGFLSFASPGVPRLGIPPYNAWNEGMHGVSRAGTATVYPQPIGMAASFDPGLLGQCARAIAIEFRVKHHHASGLGDYGIYKGLTVWSPNVNIFRDPRWGRGHETYGEDPYLTSVFAVAFIRGLQADHACVATVKHFAVHSGPEGVRHSFDARVSAKDLYETYLPAFEAAVRDAGVQSVMSSYNRINGIPASADEKLLTGLLRTSWGFEGFVVSDCGAVTDIHAGHRWTKGPKESAATALKAGCDMQCDLLTGYLPQALEEGLIEYEDLLTAARRVLTARFSLGQFDPPENSGWEKLPYATLDSPEHRELSRAMARESLVLVKNREGLLPLVSFPKSIAVIGPNADDRQVLLANYHGRPSKTVTILEGIRAMVPEQTRLNFSEGCHRFLTRTNCWGESDKGLFSEAVTAARESELVILVLGLGPELEGEEGDAANSDGGGDRRSLSLPGHQVELFERLAEEGKPIVVILIHGGPVLYPEILEKADAIIDAFYPGQEGGSAVAQTLFGYHNPSGRFPVTTPAALSQLPAFEDYSLEGRGYRFGKIEPFLPFGFGLSYSSFSYLSAAAELLSEGDVALRVSIRNEGPYDGREVVQVYLSLGQNESIGAEDSKLLPNQSLIAFRKVQIALQEVYELQLVIERERFCYFTSSGKKLPVSGKVRLIIAGSQNDPRSLALGAARGLEIECSL